MNVAEICGLQWKRVNLTEAWSNTDGESIPPRTIAVRKQWYRGELGGLKKSRIAERQQQRHRFGDVQRTFDAVQFIGVSFDIDEVLGVGQHVQYRFFQLPAFDAI